MQMYGDLSDQKVECFIEHGTKEHWQKCSADAADSLFKVTSAIAEGLQCDVAVLRDLLGASRSVRFVEESGVSGAPSSRTRRTRRWSRHPRAF